MRKVFGRAGAVGLSAVAALTLGAGLALAATTVVSPSSADWYFYNDQNDAVLTESADHGFVAGPGTPVIGTGSVHLTKTTNDSYGIATAQFAGTPLSDITALQYSTYRTSGTSAQVPSLGFDIDTDNTVADTTYEGRLTYEPYFTQTVNTGAWQTWDTLNDSAGTGTGNWWFSHAGGNVTTTCTQSDPCTWAQVKAAFPNASMRTVGQFILRTNGATNEAFDGNADNLTVGISGTNTTFDFEPAVAPVPSVTTDPATAVTISDATLNGTNGPVDAQGESFWVSTSTIDTSSPVIPTDVYSTQVLPPVAADGAFSASLAALTAPNGAYVHGQVPGTMPAITPDTTYYFVAWAEVDGTWYPGQVLSLTTSPAAVIVPTPVHVSPADGSTLTTATWDKADWTDVADAFPPMTYLYESSNSSATSSDGSFVTPAYESGTLTVSEIPTTNTPEGVYYWHVRAVDNNGNMSPWTAPWKVTVDNTPSNTVTPENACSMGTAPAGYTLRQGKPGKDVVTLAPNTMFVGHGGNDTVSGGNGNYIICLGPGNDTVTVGSGSSVIDAAGGNNTITGGNGDKRITSGPGKDTITTGSGNDTIDAGGGNNTVSSNGGNDSITGGSGKDTVNAGAGTDTCSLGGGNNSKTGCEL
jgi:hypothetical protein